MSAYAQKIAMEVIEADLRAGSRGLAHPPLEWHQAVALARAVSKASVPEAVTECAGCSDWNLSCPKCGEPKGTGKCGWIANCPVGYNPAIALPQDAMEKP